MVLLNGFAVLITVGALIPDLWLLVATAIQIIKCSLQLPNNSCCTSLGSLQFAHRSVLFLGSRQWLQYSRWHCTRDGSCSIIFVWECIQKLYWPFSLPSPIVIACLFRFRSLSALLLTGSLLPLECVWLRIFSPWCISLYFSYLNLTYIFSAHASAPSVEPFI